MDARCVSVCKHRQTTNMADVSGLTWLTAGGRYHLRPPAQRGGKLSPCVISFHGTGEIRCRTGGRMPVFAPFLKHTLCCFSFHDCFTFFDIAAHRCSIFTSICMIINQITHQLPEPEKKRKSVCNKTVMCRGIKTDVASCVIT